MTDQASASGEEVDAPPAPDPETAETGDVDAIAGADSGVDLSDRDPCSLLDPATIEATVGAPVAEGTIADLRCTWSGADDPALVVAVVVPINTAGSVDEHCQQLREFDEKLTAVAEVEGLGNRAWAHLVPAGGAGGQVAESAVTACTEAGVVIVGLVATLDEATLQAANQALASEALGRI